MVDLLLDIIEQVQHLGREVLVVMCGKDLSSMGDTKGVDREGKEGLADRSIGTNHKRLITLSSEVLGTLKVSKTRRKVLKGNSTLSEL